LISKFLETIHEHSLLLVADLYSNPHLTSKIIQEILKNITNNLLVQLFTNLFEIIKPILNNETVKTLKNVFDVCSKPFLNVQTEYLFLKTLKAKSLYT